MGIKVKGVKDAIVHIQLANALLVNAIKADLVAATPVDTGKARAGWKVKGSTITNNVSYIGDLNRGSSQQAPPHFIEKVLSKYI
jgi:hypothetical protein